MSLVNKKNEILNNIKLYSSIQNSTKIFESNSINVFDSDDPIDFLFTLIKNIAGESYIEILLAGFLNRFLTTENLDNLSDKIFSIIINKIPENSLVSSNLLNQPIKIPIRSFDLLDSFKNNDEYSDEGYTSIKNVLKNPNTITTFGSIQYLNISFNQQTNELILFILEPKKIKDVILDLFLVMGSIFTITSIIKTLLNFLFGNKSNYDLENYNKLRTLLQTYLKNETENVYEIDLSKLFQNQYIEDQKAYTINVNCFIENITITETQIENILDNSNDLITSMKKLIPNITSDGNQNNQNDYLKKILKGLLEAFLFILFKNPIFTLILNILQFLTNPLYEFVINIEEYIKNFSKSISELIDLINEEFICYIFNFIKNEILKIIISVTLILLKEKIQKRIDILNSLISL